MVFSVRSGSSSGCVVIQSSAWEVDCWSGGVRVKREYSSSGRPSAVRPLAPPVYLAGYLRRVDHVDGPTVRGCDDLTIRFGIRGMVNPLRKRHHEDNGPLGERWDRAKWEVLRNDRKSCAKLTEVRGIVNSKDSELMQGLILGRRSVHGYPKVTSELSAMGHQNFLFDMKRICP
ncbi:hypothetical protein GW17_00058058 [Ensete ventricosum]|nr:hypothetical protein GW17_00058058 [Ensete ventricosum]